MKFDLLRVLRATPPRSKLLLTPPCLHLGVKIKWSLDYIYRTFVCADEGLWNNINIDVYFAA